MNSESIEKFLNEAFDWLNNLDVDVQTSLAEKYLGHGNIGFLNEYDAAIICIKFHEDK